MGAEIGATTSTFGYDDSMRRYLTATGRADVVEAADQVAEHLTGDPEVYANPEQYFDQVIELNKSNSDMKNILKTLKNDIKLYLQQV